MKVSKSQLVQYSIPDDFFFARRTGTGMPTSRDEFFNGSPARLIPGIYDAIGNDTDGWELEMFNGVNWITIEPDPSYSLIITKAGLAAINDATYGGLQLKFTGLKIIDRIVQDPAIPVIDWLDSDLLAVGSPVFTVGTQGSPNVDTNLANPLINQILRWRFNTAAGGLQYIVTLPPEGFGALSDQGDEEWGVGTIGLYVKDPSNPTLDVLFGVASLPEVAMKYATGINRVGNAIKFYFNAICNNLGIISDLTITTEGTNDIPEVPNETLLTYPHDNTKRPHNCYLVDNLYGSGMPAIALPITSDITGELADWSFIQANENFIRKTPADFAPEVDDYMFVYWNPESELYELAEGTVESSESNSKAPLGIRIGDNIVFTGEIRNTSTSFEYLVELQFGGLGYAKYDQILLVCGSGITFKCEVTDTSAEGAITGFTVIGPTSGNQEIQGSPRLSVPAIYDPRSQLPRSGEGALFYLTSNQRDAYLWNFPADWINKPVYCDYSLTTDNEPNAGRPTNQITSAFLGWCTGTNSIRLSLDLTNEATSTMFGVTRYATDLEVREVRERSATANSRSVTPQTLNDNYLQSSLPTNPDQAGSSLANPINVQSYVRFDKVVLGKGTVDPYNSESHNPDITNEGISFYGTSYRAFWADLAEYYEADKFYEAGTLMTMGAGEKEMTIATTECNGIVSTRPGYQLGEKKTNRHLPVALVGRVPVLMDGLCMPKFGDKIYLSKVKPGHASNIENGKCLGKIIEKNFGTAKRVECAVRIEF